MLTGDSHSFYDRRITTFIYHSDLPVKQHIKRDARTKTWKTKNLSTKDDVDLIDKS